MQWHMQVGNITNNLKVEIYFILPECSVTKIMMWNYYVDDSTKGRYGIIICRDLLRTLGLNLKVSEHIIKAYYGPLKV